MAKKPSISTVASGYQGTATINNNFQNLRNAFDNTLSLDGSTPNAMLSELDMNSRRILNLVAPSSSTEPVRKYEFDNVLNDVESIVKGLDLDGTASYTSQGTNAVPRLIYSKLSDTFSVKDFGAVGNGVADDSAEFNSARDAGAALNKVITVPAGTYLNSKPSSVANKNILWDYIDGGDADNVLTPSGDRGGLFSDYDCKATRIMIGQFTESQPSISVGSFRDVLFLSAVDSDTTNYTAMGQTVTHALRSVVQGAHNGADYQAQYKDLVGGYFSASGNIQWSARGVSAVTADAYQFGIGIASNEFAVNNPSAANGSLAQSISMAAVQAIVRSRYADEDSTHTSRGVYISNHGLRITNGLEILSDTSGGFSSHYRNAINMVSATVTENAIKMPQSAANNVGTIIEYDPNDYTIFNRSQNWYGFAIGGAFNFAVTPKGISIGTVAPTVNTRMFIEGSTTALSHLQLYPGTTPSAPTNGEMWFDGTNVKIVVGGVVKTFTLT